MRRNQLHLSSIIHYHIIIHCSYRNKRHAAQGNLSVYYIKQLMDDGKKVRDIAVINY